MPVPIPPVRPENLPDFLHPPINEALLGVQFSPPTGYQQIRAGEVWGLFKSDYPNVQELPPLTPSFETFGRPGQSNANQINFTDGPLHDRYWFVRQDGSELIQFQENRLLHNWRKIGDLSNQYPRFESMVVSFENELIKLDKFMSDLSSEHLAINQCEISYINHIAVDAVGSDRASHWLRFISLETSQPESFAAGFKETIRNEGGAPFARFSCDAASGINSTGKSIIGLTLTVRGAPAVGTIEGAIEFLKFGRELIVRRFAELTTESAHKAWGRKDRE
jgi:uncharacterized protein (TIGR04255 family)